MTPSPEAFRQALDGLDLPDGLGWGVSGPADAAVLYPEEADAVARAIPARRAEFAGGRQAARKAMVALGLPPRPVLARQDRAPVWPSGLTGSISHADGLCVACVAPLGLTQAAGLDLEPGLPLAHDLFDQITRPDEPVGPEPLLDLRRRFSAKEAVYKAQYPLTGVLFGFHALHVDLESGMARFPDHPETAAIPPDFRGRTLRFRQWSVAGYVLSLCLIPARDGD